MAFHNIPPNGFPDLPDIEDLEAVEKDVATLKRGLNDSEKDIYAAMGEMGAKNLITYPYVFLTSVNRGITFTANADGTVSFSGTADNANPSAVNMITRSMYKLKKGSYTLSGGSGSYGGTSIFFYDYASGTNYTGNYTGLLKNSSNQVYIYTTLDGDRPTSTNLYGYDKTFTIEKDAYVDISVRSMTNSYEQSVSGVIYPMLRLASDTDNTYQPYAKTNKQLTDDVALLDSEKANTDMVAADFNAGTSYTAGNYCVQDGKLYKFKNNHSGAWSSADVDEVKITGELSALKSGLTNVQHSFTKRTFELSASYTESYYLFEQNIALSGWYPIAVASFRGSGVSVNISNVTVGSSENKLYCDVYNITGNNIPSDYKVTVDVLYTKSIMI